ncbi:MAG: bifunctional [glutamate--ammonia ligase]-adenylyl-L-tyrosine phosphorylase/[glutamate--ammonia-ligase] adenylyltransferase [Geobacteraceae bacterium]|nr:bifunctional [glutamate--ammonia ligase]-adenylyl-L-tyrosine phosphorylase/[glutamate--ammonia-ligase] adenylyltransferase [Geobacteraceae bacterium]
MTDRPGFEAELEACLAQGDTGESCARLAALLESLGYLNCSSSVANLRLLAGFLPIDLLAVIVRNSLLAPSPDQALNGLERISSAVPPEELAGVCAQPLQRAHLLTICGSSPFLASIICRYPEYFRGLFLEDRINTAGAFHEKLAMLRSACADVTDFKALLPILRRFKYSEILRIAARDLAGLASLEDTTGELSDLAAASLEAARQSCLHILIREHGRPLMHTSSGETEAEFLVLGMGKLGGRELNFSSDIDLVYFYSSDEGETEGITLPDGMIRGRISLHSFFAKLAEMVTKALSQVTEDGFVFRVDLGLRPEGKSGDLALSLRSAEVYYEAWGQSWERSAMLKAWPVAGSMVLGEQFLRMIEPFVYRKYLDYTLVEDMMAMKKKIDLSLAREKGGETNIKLGRGGIREIEFFIQALQLVFAGKNPALRVRNSLQALQALRDSHIISGEDCDSLSYAYRFLRMVEHRIQVVQERQTHSLPASEEEMLALARRCGYLEAAGLRNFRETLEFHRSKVSEIYGGLFLSRDKRLKEDISPETYFFFDAGADPDLVKDMLAERHFEDVDAAYENLVILRDGTPRIRLSQRGQRLREAIVPLMLQEIITSPDPDMALANSESFLHSVGQRASFYALLAENREILKLLVSLFGMSKFLSKIFIQNPELLDNMVSRTLPALKELSDAKGELDSLLANAEDFEESLDILRRYRNEEFVRIGMQDIFGEINQAEIAGQLTNLAETCLDAACGLAVRELSRFGTPIWVDPEGVDRPASLAILGMGKLGGKELNYHSDLDIIYVYDFQGMTNGEKKISNHEYFAKLGQKIISILTTPTREGYVYKIDTRLRPSGNAGPLVTSLESFRSYHRNEALIWERQALTKARVVMGESPLKDDIEGIIRETVYGRSAGEEVRREIHRLRKRMETELARESLGSYNIKTGRGGMVDVEFVVQYLQLKHGMDYPEIRGFSTLEALEAIRDHSLVTKSDFATLHDGYVFLRHLENRLRIIHDYSMNDLGGSKAYLNKLARRLGYDEKLHNPGEALMSDYERITTAIRDVYDRILGTEKPA